MMEAEILAVLEGFKAISSLEDRIGRRVANKIAIYIDNLEGQRLIASIMAEPMGSALLESMSMNSPRVRHYVRTIREEADKYQSVTFLWTHAHTRSSSYIAQGNAKADKLTKDGLCIALNKYHCFCLFFYNVFSFLSKLSGPKRETLLEKTSNEDMIHKSLFSKSAGGGCLHDLNQTSYRLC